MTKYRSRLLVPVVVVMAVLGTAGACNPPPNATPEQKVLLTANDVTVALGTLQHAAIALNEKQVCNTATPPVCNPLLSEANTRIIQENVTSTLIAMGPNPTNLQTTVQSVLSEIEKRMDAAGKTKMLPYIQAVKVVAGLIPILQ